MLRSWQRRLQMPSTGDQVAPLLESRLKEMVPAGVCVRAAATSHAAHASLQQVQSRSALLAADARRYEFQTGRYVAGEALLAAGSKSRFVGRTPRGMPIWPTGFTGSITHTHGLCLAVAARTGTVSTIGIDLERGQEVSADLAALIRRDDELADVPLEHYFSAKEAIFKAWYPLTLAEAEFTDVRVDWKDAACFEARFLHRSAPHTEFVGRCETHGPYVLAVAWPGRMLTLSRPLGTRTAAGCAAAEPVGKSGVPMTSSARST